MYRPNNQTSPNKPPSYRVHSIAPRTVPSCNKQKLAPRRSHTPGEREREGETGGKAAYPAWSSPCTDAAPALLAPQERNRLVLRRLEAAVAADVAQLRRLRRRGELGRAEVAARGHLVRFAGHRVCGVWAVESTFGMDRFESRAAMRVEVAVRTAGGRVAGAAWRVWRVGGGLE